MHRLILSNKYFRFAGFLSFPLYWRTLIERNVSKLTRTEGISHNFEHSGLFTELYRWCIYFIHNINTFADHILHGLCKSFLKSDFLWEVFHRLSIGFLIIGVCIERSWELLRWTIAFPYLSQELNRKSHNIPSVDPTINFQLVQCLLAYIQINYWKCFLVFKSLNWFIPDEGKDMGGKMKKKKSNEK